MLAKPSCLRNAGRGWGVVDGLVSLDCAVVFTSDVAKPKTVLRMFQ